MTLRNDNETRMSEAEMSGDKLTMLLTLRKMLAERFDIAAPRDTASIARQLQLTIDMIEAMQSGKGEPEDSAFEKFMRDAWVPN